jgi:hypothetical protein
VRIAQILQNLVSSGSHFQATARRGNIRVLRSLLGPAWRGFVAQNGKSAGVTTMETELAVALDWHYERAQPAMAKLYVAATNAQWRASELDWSRGVDPANPGTPLLPDSMLLVSGLPAFERLTRKEKDRQKAALLSWLLSQFLHGEQGALLAACQVTSCVPWTDGKLYGSTQVVDEGRHVEVFHTYLTSKLEKLYEINDNLYVIVDALMTDGRWDVKFLGMQIMIEGLALGAFGAIRQLTGEPLLKELLRYVITDEARHVHYGVLAIDQFFRSGIDERERRDREDWAFELAVLLHNRFLAHEFYDEFYAHCVTRREWDRQVLASPMMTLFRQTMFKRIVPNLKRLGLLSDRVRPRYAKLGILDYEHGRAAPELTAADLLDGVGRESVVRPRIAAS